MEHQKAAEATGDLTGNKIADKITKVSKNSQQNNSETVINENDKEIPKERYISPEAIQNIIDNLRLIYQYDNGISKIISLLGNTPNQPTKFRTKNWVEINDGAHGTYNTNS